LRAVVFRAVRLRVVFRAPVAFFAVRLRVVLRAPAFLAVRLRAVVLRAVDLRAVDFLAVDLRAVDFLAARLRDEAFFVAALAVFFAATFASLGNRDRPVSTVFVSEHCHSYVVFARTNAIFLSSCRDLFCSMFVRRDALRAAFERAKRVPNVSSARK
jgi:hypothetical protein